MQKFILIILFFQFGQIIHGQSRSITEDSCVMLYIQGGELHLNFEIDSLNKALTLFDRVLSGNCSNDIKNYCLYNKAQTLGKLNRNKEALILLNESNYPESDSSFLSYINQEKYYIHRYRNQNKKALKDINRALSLNPKDDEFHYRKADVLYDLEKYNDALIELTLIRYQEKYDVLIHHLTFIAAFKTGDLKLSEESSQYIIKNKEKYNEKTVNTANSVILLIKQKNSTLTESEAAQLNSLKEKDINSEMKKEIK